MKKSRFIEEQIALAWLLLLACGAACAAPLTVERATEVAAEVAAPMTIGGRTTAEGGGVRAYQWPGVYFETAFHGTAIDFVVGPGAAILRVRVDGADAATLEKPAPGAYRVAGMAEGAHVLRLETATESPAGPNRFGGFLLPPGSHALPLPVRTRRIEFIGDSHTVGYGNLSAKRECSEAEVWATTDNTRAYGPLVARHFDADYRVSAISGRGVVRNYGGAPGRTLPQAWPYVLPDGDARVEDGWRPQLVVVALGTNDFSTPLRPGEPWKDRQALRDDYVRRYVGFIGALRQRWPQAHFVLWSTGLFDGEIRAQVRRVLAELRQAGETRVEYLPVDGLSMQGCHWHPSLADHERIAALLVRRLDGQPSVWNGAPADQAATQDGDGR